MPIIKWQFESTKETGSHAPIILHLYSFDELIEFAKPAPGLIFSSTIFHQFIIEHAGTDGSTNGTTLEITDNHVLNIANLKELLLIISSVIIL